jgi:cob(I)alamin adenosyltransferase
VFQQKVIDIGGRLFYFGGIVAQNQESYQKQLAEEYVSRLRHNNRKELVNEIGRISLFVFVFLAAVALFSLLLFFIFN